MQGDMMMPFIHANDLFRRVRKLVNTELRPKVSLYWPLQPLAFVQLFNTLGCNGEL